jgi:transcriptional regulator with XRE-family HTH domain
MSYMPAKDEQPISRVLREAIADSGLSFKRLEKETGVLRQSLMKFARGEQSLRGDFLDRLAAFFDLELRAKRKGR